MKKLSNFDEISDVGYDHPSPSMDHSAPNTPAFSPMSRDSLAYCRAWTSSEASNSNFSEIVDDSSYSSEPSPCRWTAVKASPMKLRKHSLDDKLDDSDLLDSGWFVIACLGNLIRFPWSKNLICSIKIRQLKF